MTLEFWLFSGLLWKHWCRCYEETGMRPIPQPPAGSFIDLMRDPETELEEVLRSLVRLERLPALDIMLMYFANSRRRVADIAALQRTVTKALRRRKSSFAPGTLWNIAHAFDTPLIAYPHLVPLALRAESGELTMEEIESWRPRPFLVPPPKLLPA